MGNIIVSGPSEAACVSGTLFGPTNKRYISGGWGWAWWCLTDVKKINLGVITLHPTCSKVETSLGVPLFIDGIAQVRVMYNEQDNQLLEKACQNFMGRSQTEMENILTSTLDGHLRGIVGQMTPTEVFQDRTKFADEVEKIVIEDFGKMGIELISFQIQKIEDEVNYFNSIGRSQTAVAKKDAAIGTTIAKEASDIQVAVCDEAMYLAKSEADRNVSDFEKEYLIVKNECKAESDKAMIDAKLAYDIQKYKELMVIREEEIKVDVLKVEKEIEIAVAEIDRKERELVSKVRQPADYNVRKVDIIAKGKRDAKIKKAEAQAERIRLVGKAEAAAIMSVGVAESNAMKVKAEAMQNWGKAAIIQMVLESLPGFAAEVSAPLSKISDVVILGGENSNGKGDKDEMMQVLSSVKAMNMIK